MANSIRKQCLAAIKTLITGMTIQFDNGQAPYTVEHVQHGPLDQTSHKKRLVIGIVPGQERKNTRYPIVDCTLPLTLEMRFVINQGDAVPGMEVEGILAAVENQIYTDRNLSGLAIDLRPTGNDVDLEQYDDKTVQAALFWEMLYRHNVNDVTTN